MHQPQGAPPRRTDSGRRHHGQAAGVGSAARIHTAGATIVLTTHYLGRGAGEDTEASDLALVGHRCRERA